MIDLKTKFKTGMYLETMPVEYRKQVYADDDDILPNDYAQRLSMEPCELMFDLHEYTLEKGWEFKSSSPGTVLSVLPTSSMTYDVRIRLDKTEFTLRVPESKTAYAKYCKLMKRAPDDRWCTWGMLLDFMATQCANRVMRHATMQPFLDAFPKECNNGFKLSLSSGILAKFVHASRRKLCGVIRLDPVVAPSSVYATSHGKSLAPIVNLDSGQTELYKKVESVVTALSHYIVIASGFKYVPTFISCAYTDKKIVITNFDWAIGNAITPECWIEDTPKHASAAFFENHTCDKLCGSVVAAVYREKKSEGESLYAKKKASYVSSELKEEPIDTMNSTGTQLTMTV